MATENPGHPFDEQAALQALEQLRDQIEDARSRREQMLAEFEAFVRANRAASQAERLAALSELEGSASPVQTAARTADRARDLSRSHYGADAPRPESSVPRLEPVHHSYMPEPGPDPFAIAPSFWQDHRYRFDWRDRRSRMTAGVAALLLLVLMLWRPWSDSPSDAAAPTSSVKAASAAGPQGTPATPTTSPRALQVELTTIRPVWMRVTVDGQRQVERQVPGGQTLAFGANRAIALRAGDAGAVRLAIGGADQGLLGRDGQVVNRTLTAARR